MCNTMDNIIDPDKYELGFRILDGVCQENCVHCGNKIPKYDDRPNEYFEHVLTEHFWKDNHIENTIEHRVGFTCLECDTKIFTMSFIDGIKLFKKIIDGYI